MIKIKLKWKQLRRFKTKERECFELEDAHEGQKIVAYELL